MMKRGLLHIAYSKLMDTETVHRNQTARSIRGESITEVLVAIVVAGLAILMLAMVVSTAATVVAKSRASMDEYYALNNALVHNQTSSLPAEGQAASGTATLDITDESGNVQAGSPQVALVQTAEGASGSVAVSYVVSTQTSGVPIVAYVAQGIAGVAS